MQKSAIKGTILLYNLAGTSYEKQLKMLLIRLGFRMKSIDSSLYTQPLGYLAGLKDFHPTEEQPEEVGVFTEPMMVFHGLSNMSLDLLLKELRKANIRIHLKAVLTPHNIHWNSIALYNELTAEHEKYKQLEAKQSKEK